jgi:hypothetical protein
MLQLRSRVDSAIMQTNRIESATLSHLQNHHIHHTRTNGSEDEARPKHLPVSRLSIMPFAPQTTQVEIKKSYPKGICKN